MALFDLQVSQPALKRIALALERLADCAERAFPPPKPQPDKKPAKIGREGLTVMTDELAYEQEHQAWRKIYGSAGAQDARLGATERE